MRKRFLFENCWGNTTHAAHARLNIYTHSHAQMPVKYEILLSKQRPIGMGNDTNNQ